MNPKENKRAPKHTTRFICAKAGSPAHTDAARYHVHGQEKPDDAGKPGAWKARTPGFEGAGQKKEQQCHLRWLATLRRSHRHHRGSQANGADLCDVAVLQPTTLCDGLSQPEARELLLRACLRFRALWGRPLAYQLR